jgi:hypothetical protein
MMTFGMYKLMRRFPSLRRQLNKAKRLSRQGPFYRVALALTGKTMRATRGLDAIAPPGLRCVPAFQLTDKTHDSIEVTSEEFNKL